jgi:hypothetical protein
MTRRTRIILIVVAIATILIGFEVGFTLWRGSQACIQVENLGEEPMENVVLTCGSSRASVPRIEGGRAAQLYLGGDSTNTLSMSFRQRGNAMTGFQMPGFNPAQLNREDFKLMLRVRTNEVERFQEDGEPSTPLGRMARDVQKWFVDLFRLTP